jgi:murein DD-endopeptidase MepM/ murein hydrolase activator NlpD
MIKFLQLFLFICLLCIVSISYSQPINERIPNGGGNYATHLAIKDELTADQRTAIVTMLQANESSLRNQGLLPQSFSPLATLFAWPLKQALGVNDRGYYGISNYVDQNPSFPNLILDYNCGNRTYDQASGYNHKGTDIFTWPFSWQKMQRNAVEIIAGAAGTILAKSDGNFDQNCAFCGGACNWNAVYIMHADGSVAWYGHMKSGSLTSKPIGASVVVGEYLGVVGSSGNSTGPHLHFELYTNSSYTQLIDPWAGTCNYINGMNSGWISQEPYYVSTLNKVMTHGAAPATSQCPAGENSNEKINFVGGDVIYFGSYYRDQQAGQQAVHRVYRPDNVLHTSWVQNLTVYYSASWWYYFITLPAGAMAGNWRYEITYNSKKSSQLFLVSSGAASVCPESFTPIVSNVNGINYQWQVNTGSGFTNVINNSIYQGANTNKLLLNKVPSSYYGYSYRCLVDGALYSNVISLKFESYWTGYKNSDWNDVSNWSCGNVPDANTDVIVESGMDFYSEVNINTACRTLTTATGANVTVKPGINFTILK